MLWNFVSFNLGKLISNGWDLRLCGREQRIWEQGHFNGISQIIRKMPVWYIKSSFCWMFFSQMLALRYKFITDYFMCSDADCIGKLLTNGDLLLILEWKCKESKFKKTLWKEWMPFLIMAWWEISHGETLHKRTKSQGKWLKVKFRLKDDISIPWTSPLPGREWNAQPSGKCKMTRD